MTIALACLLPPQLVVAAQPAAAATKKLPAEAAALVREIDVLRKQDVATKPKEWIERIQALLIRVDRVPTVPLMDRLEVRQILAAAYLYDQEHARAEQELDGVLAELHAAGLGDGDKAAYVLKNKAVILSQAGRLEDSLSILQKLRAQRLQRKGHESREYAALLNEIGVTQYRLGHFVESEAALREAVSILRTLSDVPPQEVIQTWQSWSVLLRETGDLAGAVNEAQRGAAFAEKVLGEQHRTTSLSLHNLGGHLLNAGRYAEAESVLRRALAIRQKMDGEQSIDAVYTLNELGNALKMQGRLEEAQSVIQSAFDAVVAMPKPPIPSMPAELLLNIATIADQRGLTDDALRLRKDAMSRAIASVGDAHPTASRARADVADSLLARGQVDEAVALLKQAVDAYAKSVEPNHRQRVAAEIQYGIAQAKAGDMEGLARAESVIQRLRQQLIDQMLSPQQTMRTARQFSAQFVDYANAALDAGRDESAFQALQLAQLGELDTAGAALLSRHQAGDAQVGRLARVLQDASAELNALRAKRSDAVGAGDPVQVDAIDAKIADLQKQVQDDARRLDAAFPAYAQLIRPEPQSLAAVQSRLRDGDALLISLPARSDVLSMLVTRRGTAHARTALTGSMRDDLVRRVRASIDDTLMGMDDQPAFDVAAARALHAAILPAQLDKQAAKAKRLYVMSGGSLGSVPMAALVTGRGSDQDTHVTGDALRKTEWLIKRQAVLTPVSLRMLGTRTPTQTSRSAQARFAGIGAPALAPAGNDMVAMRGLRKVLRSGTLDATSVRDMPSLPGARGELERMRDAFGLGDALLLTGAQATEAQVRKTDLSRYDVLAFATHGLVSGALRGLGEPSLVLTPGTGNDVADDGLLTASDIAELKLDADWVILSACDTAAGDSAGAPMFSGLARAFVHAGTRSLLLSQWEVRDDVASRLSVDTVQRSHRGMDRAEALRRAQLDVIADRRIVDGAHPAYWAPYMLIGE